MRQARADFIARIRSQHPQRRSLCGALLAETLGDGDFDDRRWAAYELGLLRCRRGIGALERLITPLRAAMEASDDEWVGPPERRFLELILIALGYMDTPMSHALLSKLVRESTSHLVRADTLEAVAFEEERFDFDLVLPFAQNRASPPEILSALYALEFHNYANFRPEEARAVVTPLLSHPYPLVPIYGIGVLKFRASNLDLILPLTDSSNEQVRQAGAEAVEFAQRTDLEAFPQLGSGDIGGAALGSRKGAKRKEDAQGCVVK